MKKYFFITILCLSSFSVKAAEENNIKLTLPPNFAINICPQKVWSDMPLYMEKVSDLRESSFLGEVARGSDNIDVFANPPLDYQFQKALEGLLTTCGMRRVSSPVEATTLKVSIDKFYAGGKKKFLTEKTEAESRLTIVAERDGNRIFDVDIGFSIESKGARKKSIKQLTKVLDELFYETLKQIPGNKYLGTL